MASQVSGTDIKIALYDENVSYGVSPLTPFNGRVAYVNKCGVAAERNTIQSSIITGGRGMRRPGIGNTSVAGVIETSLAPETLGFWLKHCLSVPETTGASAPYSHLFRPNVLPIGFMLEKSYIPAIADKVERFNGMRIASADFSFKQEDFATVSMQTIGKKHTLVAAALDDTLNDTGHTGWSGFEGRIKKDGTILGGVIAMNLKIDNSIPGGPYCFATLEDPPGVRSGNPEGRCKISGSIECVFQNFDLLDLALASTDVSFQADYTHGTGVGTAGNEKVTFSVTHSLLSYKSPPVENESGIIMTLDFNAFAPSAADYGGLQVTLLNAVSAAAL
jgi:hypothetical protein